MVTEVITCPHCASTEIVEDNVASNGKQKYLRYLRGRQSRENPSSNGYTTERKEEILSAYQERSTLRGLRRIFGVIGWLKKSNQTVARLEPKETLLFTEAPDGNEALEPDEPWSFVHRKSEKVRVWVALCRETRQVVAFVMGDCSRASCERLWRAVFSECYKGATCYSDPWQAYREAIPEERHEAVVGKEEGETYHVASVGSTPSRTAAFVASCVRRSPSPSRAGCTIVA